MDHFAHSPFSHPIAPDWEGFLKCLSRNGFPGRVHFIELFLDEEVKTSICSRFAIDAPNQRCDPHYYHKREIAILGGIDVDFLCRAGEDAVRQRVHETSQACQPSGGYCLGTGNSMANDIPIANYLAMLDEGRRFSQELNF